MAKKSKLPRASKDTMVRINVGDEDLNVPDDDEMVDAAPELPEEALGDEAQEDEVVEECLATEEFFNEDDAPDEEPSVVEPDPDDKPLEAVVKARRQNAKRLTRGQRKMICVNIPASLLPAIDAAAAAEGVSRSSLVCLLLLDKYQKD